MSLVAFFALSGDHVGAVRLVALGAERNLAVNIMAEAARQTAVFALDLPQLDDLLGMAGQALVGDVVCQLDDFWRMGVVMASQAAGQVIVGLAGVTLAAGRNNLFDCRRMTGVAVLTRDTRLVRSAIGGNIGRRSRVALNAVRTGQHRPVSCKSAYCQHSCQYG